jgi:hypothetical protein
VKSTIALVISYRLTSQSTLPLPRSVAKLGQVSNNPSMQAAFPFVLFGSIVLFVVVGVMSMFTRSNLYDQIGQGGLTMGDDPFGGGAPPEPGGIGGLGDGFGSQAGATGGASGTQTIGGGASIGDRAERELEIRQMLQARSDRLVRQGQAPLDIDAEFAKLQPTEYGRADGSGSHDAALAEEVRQLVVALNERRGRQGLEPIDVDAEVQRTLDELDP